MQAFYIAWNLVSIIALTIFSIIAYKKKTRLSPLVASLCALAAVCIFSYLAQFFTLNKRLALVLCSAYYICDLLVLFIIYIFVVSIAEIAKPIMKTTPGQAVFLVVMALDAAALLSNIWTEALLGLTPVFNGDGSFNYWARHFHWPIYFNLAMQIFMCASILIALLKRTFKLPNFYRINFVTIAALFLFVITLSSVYYFNAFKFELSILLYVILGAYAFQISFWGINAALLNTMISLVSENISYSVACFDERGKCFYLNKEARAIFGVGTTGRAAAEGYRNKLKAQYPDKMFGFLTLTQTMNVGSLTRSFDCEYKILKDKKGREVVSYLKLVDTTEELARLEEERIRSEQDPVTGLYNRSTFFKRASEILRASKDTDFYLVATNIMDFKLVNNSFGEQVGDEVLKLQAAAFTSGHYPNSVFGRISADRFAALIPKNYFDVKTFLQNNSIIQQAVEKYNFKLQNHTGIYEVSDKYENVKLMYDKAAMTIDSIRGNLEKKYAFYDTSLMDKQIHDKRMLSEFDQALANGEFEMFLQPQISAKDNKILGAEALARWISPEKGIIAPINFIPLLEKSGLIHKLDQYMWEKAAEKLAEWKKAGIDLYISINISAKDFYYCDLYKFLTGLVEKYQIDPKKLNIEITETVLMQDINTHRSVLQKLSSYGFTIEMDDFGSGYSSLNTLKNVEMNTLKIDMGFLRASDVSQKIKDIISSIISMSKTLGMTVITEGVETKAQVDFLKESNCDIFQGYYFSKPISVSEFEKKIASGGIS
ncbi:MAG: GGDEF domain-containing phosphodiesterase [Treponema sp.]|nr:GGDEF domain-containing phosphodiesterase [Treponema sp.]